MKKINLIFKKADLKNLDLVKGCPTDWNGDGNDDDYNHNGQDDDDFNGDGDYNSWDEAYWAGYDDGYNDDDNEVSGSYLDHLQETDPTNSHLDQDNPYEPGTPEHVIWENGHREGSKECY